MADPGVICVLGMHRSGTSAVARILNLMGWSLGPAEKLMPPAEFNPSGHWEYQPFVDINDEILATFDGSWDRPPHWSDVWHRSAALEPFRDRVRRLLETDFPPGLAWAWKDPRTCLTLPFWQDLLPSMKYVVCLRNPLDVALSLQRRDGFSLAKGGDLWLDYVASSIIHSTGLPRMFLFYEDLMRDWKSQVRRLGAFLEDPQVLEGRETESSIDDFVDHELEHHQSSPDEALIEEAIPYPARAVYFLLRNKIAARSNGLEGFGDGLHDFNGALDAFLRIALLACSSIEESSSRLDESERQTVMLRVNLDESQRQAAALQANLGESQRHAAMLQENLDERQRHAATLQENLGESQRHAATLQKNLEESQAQAETRRANLAERDVALAEMEHSLAVIRQSRSWRLTGPFRWLGGRLRSWIDRK